MASPRIIIVDDEELIRWSIRERLTAAGYDIGEAGTGAAGLELARKGADLVLLDFRLPDTDGLTLLDQIKAADPDILVILMTGQGSIEMAVKAMKQGAFHFVHKPFDLDELENLVGRALETTKLRREVKALRGMSEHFGFDRIVGESPAMKSVKQLLARIAASPGSTVLLTGESGTGKDLAAKAVHYNSDRADGPFMNITCSTIAETLLESELFGHERGAFTDAKTQKKGLLELSHGGSVFLDEIGEMSLALQAKLLRFLEDRTLKRVGGSVDIKVDVRVIAATNRNLEEAVQKREFREDLYYRLRVLPVAIPPLRERKGDIPLLLGYYIDRFNTEFKRNVKGVNAAALKALEAHLWPGNIREFRNAVERAMLLSMSSELGPDDFLMLVPSGSAAAGPAAGNRRFQLPSEGINFEEFERDLVRQALAAANGNQTKAAQLLGMNRDQIRYRMEKFGFDKKDA